MEGAKLRRLLWNVGAREVRRAAAAICVTGLFIPATQCVADQFAPVVSASVSCTCDGTHSNCPGCTAFRRQLSSGACPPVLQETAPFVPPVDISQVPTPDVPSPDVTSPDTTSPDTTTPDSSPFSQSPDTSPSSDSPFAEPPSNFGDGLSGPSSMSGQLASNFGGSAGSGGVPSMVGDFFGGGVRLLTSMSPAPGERGIPLPVAGGDRRHKFADNGSPIPMDRLIFNFNHYHNAVEDIRGRDVNVNRFGFGFEKTCLDQLASIEVRIPFADGLNSEQTFTGDTQGAEFGNISTTIKGLLTRNRYHALAIGMTTILPTASDALIEDSFIGTMRIDNDSIHFAPFVALLWTPTPRMFHQFYTQFDFDTGGYDVVVNGEPLGTLQEQTLMYIDYSVGYWLYQNRYGRVRGIAPIFELHHTSTVQDVDPFFGYTVDNRRDVLNMIGAIHVLLNNNTAIRVGGGAPLRTLTDREFDAEFVMQLTRYY